MTKAVMTDVPVSAIANRNTERSLKSSSVSSDNFTDIMKNLETKNEDVSNDTSLDTSKRDDQKDIADKEASQSDSVKKEDATLKTDPKDTDVSKETKDKNKNENSDTTAVMADMINLYQNMGMGETFASKIKEILGISDGEFNSLLESLGLTQDDLLNPMNLQTFVLKANQATDIMQALTDEDLGADMQKLMQELSKINSLDQTGTNNLTNVLSKQLNGQEDTTEVNSQVMQDTANLNEDKVTLLVSKDSKSMDTGSGEMKQDDNSGFNQETEEPVQTSHYETIVRNLESAGKLSFTQAADISDSMRQMREIVDQVVQNIKVTIKPDTSSMEIQLNPEHLGKVNLTVTSTNGTLHATMTTQNEMVKEALESQMITLKENLQNQGIKVDEIEVTVSDFSFKENTDSNDKEQEMTKSTKRNLNLGDSVADIGDMSEEEVLATDIMRQNGSSVDYSA